MRVAACIPVYGEAELTDRVVAQLREESSYVHVYICDNRGDYSTSASNVTTLRAGENLGWLRGTNHAWRTAVEDSADYDAFLLLNNDVVLCCTFVKQLFRAVEDVGASVVVPLYDRGWPHQIAYKGPAKDFIPTRRYDNAFWMDGTCILVTRSAYERIGLLDEEHFANYGWGASLDYGIRARRGGFLTVVSWQAYLNHLQAATAKKVIQQYRRKAVEEREGGMREKYGRFWRVHMTSRFGRKLGYIARGLWGSLR